MVEQLSHEVRSHFCSTWMRANQRGEYIYVGQCGKCGEPLVGNSANSVCQDCGARVHLHPIWRLGKDGWISEDGAFRLSAQT